ncbi:MAG: ABC transporter ATP-binding protein, partial [Aldersonia sp.]|nr:ABC transporter ATP-binding protein [Aldersonia sp.]
MTRPGPGPAIPAPMPGAPGTKAKSFRSSFKRLMTRLAPERLYVFAIVLFAVVSVVLTILGPSLLGAATNRIFDGVVGKQLPAGITKEQAVDGLRAEGDNTFADMLSSMDVVPGVGIDFDAVGRILGLVVLLYLGSAVFSWVQGLLLNVVIQRTVRRLRHDVEAKLHKLPLSYFDNAPRGDVLSRVTNDVDNISTGLQQTVSQLLVSVLSVLGILAAMMWISPLLALIAVLTVPAVVLLTAEIAKRSKPHFVDQWKHTGTLNAQIEEAYTGHELVKAFGRGPEVEQRFDEKNEQLYQSSYRAQFISGMIMPVVMFLGNINYVLVAVVGGLR